jgi:hypothetical protein
MGVKIGNWGSEVKIGDENRFSFFFLFFFTFFVFGHTWGHTFGKILTFFQAAKNFSVLGLFLLFFLGLTELGDCFGTLFDFFFGADSTWGTVLGLFSLKIYGATSQGLFWTFFGPFLVWPHLRDLFGLGHISRISLVFL